MGGGGMQDRTCLHGIESQGGQIGGLEEVGVGRKATSEEVLHLVVVHDGALLGLDILSKDFRRVETRFLAQRFLEEMST